MCKDLWVGKRPMFNSLKYYLSWQRIDKLKKNTGCEHRKYRFFPYLLLKYANLYNDSF